MWHHLERPIKWMCVCFVVVVLFPYFNVIFFSLKYRCDNGRSCCGIKRIFHIVCIAECQSISCHQTKASIHFDMIFLRNRPQFPHFFGLQTVQWKLCQFHFILCTLHTHKGRSLNDKKMKNYCKYVKINAIQCSVGLEPHSFLPLYRTQLLRVLHVTHFVWTRISLLCVFLVCRRTTVIDLIL